MSESWYLMTTPNQMSGFENDYFTDYATDSFNELLTTFVGDDVTIYNSTLDVSSVVKGIVQSKDKKNEKQILLPLNSCSVGMYIKYKNLYWLITEFVNDNKMYQKAVVILCNHILKFQSPTGTILSYPCIDTTTSTMGLDESNTITTGNSIHNIKLPFDANTVLINTDRRFFIDDLSVEIPQVFFVSKPNRTEYKFGDKGLIELTMKQDAYNSQTDRKDLGICNYFEPIVEPPIPDPDIPTEIVTITSDAVNNNIKLGLLYTFSATFLNELGEPVDNVISEYSVDNTYGGKVILIDNGDGTCTVKVGSYKDTELCTEQFVLTCVDTQHEFSSSVLLTIVGLY